MSASCRRRLHPQYASFCTLLCVLTCLVSSTRAYDNEDFELFDLVEEVQVNFYELLGVESTASSSEIRKAYRKQSLLLHPDKNKEENAEEKFRQMVAVAEILKVPDMRQRYDHILEHGLPDWREPVFYYRRVRKMGLIELAILLFIILTVGHYIVLWSIYWERLLELESIIPKKKKDKKSKKANRQAAGTAPQDTEELLAQESPVDDPFMPVKPLLSDALPCKLYRLVVSTITSAPSTFLSIKSEFEMWRERRRREKEEAEAELEEDGEDEDEGKEKVKKRRRVDLPLYEYEASTTGPVTYTPAEATQENTNRAQNTKAGEWSQEEVTKLIRVMVKFPGGTTARWEKIADEILRPVDEVIKKAKQIKSGGYVVSVQTSTQGITGAVQHAVSSKTGKTFTDDIITTSSSEPIAQNDNTNHKETKRKQKVVKQPKAVDRTLLISEPSTNGTSDQSKTAQDLRQSKDDGEDVFIQGGVETCSWTQRQQKIFEKALAIYTKGTSERWEKIADAVPGKTKEECLLRYKELVETIRRKKQATVQPQGS